MGDGLPLRPGSRIATRKKIRQIVKKALKGHPTLAAAHRAGRFPKTLSLQSIRSILAQHNVSVTQIQEEIGREERRRERNIRARRERARGAGKTVAPRTKEARDDTIKNIIHKLAKKDPAFSKAEAIRQVPFRTTGRTVKRCIEELEAAGEIKRTREVPEGSGVILSPEQRERLIKTMRKIAAKKPRFSTTDVINALPFKVSPAAVKYHRQKLRAEGEVEGRTRIPRRRPRIGRPPGGKVQKQPFNIRTESGRARVKAAAIAALKKSRGDTDKTAKLLGYSHRQGLNNLARALGTTVVKLRSEAGLPKPPKKRRKPKPLVRPGPKTPAEVSAERSRFFGALLKHRGVAVRAAEELGYADDKSFSRRAKQLGINFGVMKTALREFEARAMEKPKPSAPPMPPTAPPAKPPSKEPAKPPKKPKPKEMTSAQQAINFLTREFGMDEKTLRKRIGDWGSGMVLTTERLQALKSLCAHFSRSHGVELDWRNYPHLLRYFPERVSRALRIEADRLASVKKAKPAPRPPAAPAKAPPKPPPPKPLPKPPPKPAPAPPKKLRAPERVVAADLEFRRIMNSFDAGRTVKLDIDQETLKNCSESLVEEALLRAEKERDAFGTRHAAEIINAIFQRKAKKALSAADEELLRHRDRLVHKAQSLEKLEERKQAIEARRRPLRAVGPVRRRLDVVRNPLKTLEYAEVPRSGDIRAFKSRPAAAEILKQINTGSITETHPPGKELLLNLGKAANYNVPMILVVLQIDLSTWHGWLRTSKALAEFDRQARLARG